MQQHAKNLRLKGNNYSVVIEGMRIEFWRVGTGLNTVVFIHGNSSCKEVFYQQLNNIKDESLSLIAIDLPGHGGSDNATTPTTNYTIPGYANIIAKLLTILNIHSYHLVGWSLGGNIAIEMVAQKQPVESMLIMGTPAIGPGMDNIEKAYLPSSLDAPGKAQLSSQEATDFTNAIYGTLSPVPELLYQATKRTDGQAREIMISHWMSGTSGHKQIETVQTWEQPIAVFQGEKEPFVSLDYLEKTQWKNLWQNKIHIFKNTGHASFIEKPDEFNQILVEFLAYNSQS